MTGKVYAQDHVLGVRETSYFGLPGSAVTNTAV